MPPAQDDATRYFILSDPAASDVSAVHPEVGLRIGLRPVVLEGYLKRRDMVTPEEYAAKRRDILKDL